MDIKRIVTQRFPFTPKGVADGFKCAEGKGHGGSGLVVKVMFEIGGEHHAGELWG